MNAEGLNARGLARRLRPHLNAGEAVGPASPPEFIESAVLVPLLDGPGGPALLFTRRSRRLPNHAGQIAFPGGVRDPGDRDLHRTALRESVEEVGVDPERVEILGPLNRITTLARYDIQPYLSLWPAGDYRPVSPGEVERVFQVPLDWLANPVNASRVEVQVRGHSLRVPAWLWEGETIWGATRRITADLLDRLDRGL